MENFKDGNIPFSDNKVTSLKRYGISRLETRYEPEELNNIVNWILEHFSGLPKAQLNDPDVLVNQSSIIHFSNAVDKLLAGMPVQYVIGEVEFYNLNLNINNSVLIPRPETEELVDIIVKQHKSLAGLKILDIGTGSGCIALSLAKNLEDSRVTAIDISVPALEIAKKNSLRNGIHNVEFLELNILEENYFVEKEFDIIVSNPPYIANSESSIMSPIVVQHEPAIALFVQNDDIMVFYSRIAGLGKLHLKPMGKIYVEINERFGDETVKVFESNSFSSIHLMNDLFGKKRFIKVDNL